MAEPISILTPFTPYVYSTGVNATNGGAINPYPDNCWWYETEQGDARTDGATIWGASVDKSDNLYRVQFNTSNGSARYMYIRIPPTKDDNRLLPTSEEIAAANWTPLSGSGATYNDTFVDDTITDLTFSGTSRDYVYQWTYNGNSYRFAYSTGSTSTEPMPGLIIGHPVWGCLMLWRNGARNTANWWFSMLQTGPSTSGMYVVQPAQDFDEIYGTNLQYPWYDKEVLFVDGIQWVPEQSRKGDIHYPSHSETSPCNP